jgi:hypothetical protein
MHRFGPVLLLAATIVLATTGCDSNSADGNTSAAEKQAKQFVCPSAPAVSSAYGKTVRPANRGTYASLSVSCSYVDTDPGGVNVIVSITFGVR